MTRLLYWNIENFGVNKIAQPNRKRDYLRVPYGGLTYESNDRRALLLSITNQLTPDIFVVVEIEAAHRSTRGQLVHNPGSLALLNYLQGQDPNWCLVPPIKAGPSECVAVFYKSTNLIFTGPYIWPGGDAGTSRPPALGLAGSPYPDGYNAGLGNRVIPAASNHNPGLSERNVAASVQFNYRGGHARGGPIDYNDHRAPYLATFVEMDNTAVPPAVVRNISVFAVHSPASFAARDYLQNLANVGELVNPQPNSEDRILVGDFNWNLFNVGNVRRASYNNLIGMGYTLALDPPPLPAPPPPNLLGYKSFFATHMKRHKKANYTSTNSEPAYYPGYRYTSDANYAIDNIFTRYGAPRPGLPANFTICNPIVGSPYNAAWSPVPNTPAGTLPVGISLNNPAFHLPEPLGPNFEIRIQSSFRGWDNYGKVRSLSDHLPLCFDV